MNAVVKNSQKILLALCSLMLIAWGQSQRQYTSIQSTPISKGHILLAKNNDRRKPVKPRHREHSCRKEGNELSDGESPYLEEECKDYARRMMDKKHGKGNWEDKKDLQKDLKKLNKYCCRHFEPVSKYTKSKKSKKKKPVEKKKKRKKTKEKKKEEQPVEKKQEKKSFLNKENLKNAAAVVAVGGVIAAGVVVGPYVAAQLLLAMAQTAQHING